MPIFRSENTICLFSHIPKCAGTSVESYCLDNEIKVAFIDYQYKHRPNIKAWNISSPQHIDGGSLSRLFPKDFFDFYFAVVRDPFKRFQSAFKYQKYNANSIDSDCTVSEFVKTHLQNDALQTGNFDHHFFPQVKFLFPNQHYKLFKLESGLQPVQKFIDLNLLERVQPLAKEIAHKNKSKEAPLNDEKNLLLDQEARKIFLKVYADDYKKLNYKIQF